MNILRSMTVTKLYLLLVSACMLNGTLYSQGDVVNDSPESAKDDINIDRKAADCKRLTNNAVKHFLK